MCINPEQALRFTSKTRHAAPSADSDRLITAKNDWEHIFAQSQRHFIGKIPTKLSNFGKD